MSDLTINKRASEQVVCWKIEDNTITPKTFLEIEKGLTIVVEADGNRSIQHASSTMNEIFFGKKPSLFGGNRPYKSCTIFVLDQSNEFFGEWGIGENAAINCFDKKYGVDAKAIAFGHYNYKVIDYYAFMSSMFEKNKNELTRDEIREKLRGTFTGEIKSVLSSQIAKYGVEGVQAKIGEVSELIIESLKGHALLKGMEITAMTIGNINYTKAHILEREKIDRLRMKKHEHDIGNEMKRSDLELEIERTQKIEVPVINAKKPESIVKPFPNKIIIEKTERTEKIYCSKCGAEHSATDSFCNKCGNPLKKK